ncbi:MAG: hypothetical protein MZV63_39470 [Marinilabiliales bacterium]|nr:hypothetical protein [Marinilabiliales bacterium]
MLRRSQKNIMFPDLAIGLTVVAFGTSAPELVVNVFAALQGHDEPSCSATSSEATISTSLSSWALRG